MDPLQELRLRLLEFELAYIHFNAAKALRADEPALEVLELGGLRILRDPGRAEDGDYNRVLGLRAPGLERLDEALRALAAVGAPPRVDLDLRQPEPAVVAALRERGLVVVERQTFLARLATSESVAGPGPQLAPAAPCVRRLQHSEAALFLELFAGGPDSDPAECALRARRAEHFCTPSFRGFLAELDGEPAGCATTWVRGEVGWFGSAATLPELRRRGVQGALFRARIADAQASGLRWLMTDCEVGTSSHRNAERAGFRHASSRQVWSPQPEL